jgi:hypothetical protein
MESVGMKRSARFLGISGEYFDQSKLFALGERMQFERVKNRESIKAKIVKDLANDERSIVEIMNLLRPDLLHDHLVGHVPRTKPR